MAPLLRDILETSQVLQHIIANFATKINFIVEKFK
jgi:hypothetical protein